MTVEESIIRAVKEYYQLSTIKNTIRGNDHVNARMLIIYLLRTTVGMEHGEIAKIIDMPRQYVFKIMQEAFKKVRDENPSIQVALMWIAEKINEP
jgi:chromosomal replication initiation ATPase DnaA